MFNTGHFLSRCDALPITQYIFQTNHSFSTCLSIAHNYLSYCPQTLCSGSYFDCLSPQSSGFDLSRLRVTFVVHKMALELAYHLVFQFSTASAIPPMLQTHSPVTNATKSQLLMASCSIQGILTCPLTTSCYPQDKTVRNAHYDCLGCSNLG